MIDYRAFIEDNFLIRTKEGEIVPFVFNDTQNVYYDLLVKDYPDFNGIRENLLKFRQFGGSSLIDGIIATDFIFGEQAEAPLIDADIVSHKEKETRTLFDRVEFFITSFLEKYSISRKNFLDIDSGLQLRGKRGSQILVQTGNARTSGRGGTKTHIHWSELSFYPATEILSVENLVIAAEQQVPDRSGKIFRESTGNLAGDFFSDEFDKGMTGRSVYKSRFLGWWLHKNYSLSPPSDWEVPEYYHKIQQEHGATEAQCFWHFMKTEKLKNKFKMREYPSDSTEAFLLGGEQYFDGESLIYYGKSTTNQLTEGVIYV